MTNSIATTISGSLNGAALWGEVANILPVVLPLILFGFGFYIFRKVLKTTRTGKTKI